MDAWWILWVLLRDHANLCTFDTTTSLSGVLWSFNRASFDVITPSAVFHPQRVEIEGGTEGPIVAEAVEAGFAKSGSVSGTLWPAQRQSFLNG